MKRFSIFLVSIFALLASSCDKFGIEEMETSKWEIVDGPAASHPTTLFFKGDFVTIEYANSKVYPLQNGRWEYTIWRVDEEMMLELSRITFDSDGEEDEDSFLLSMSLSNYENIMTLGYTSLFHSSWTYDFTRIQ